MGRSMMILVQSSSGLIGMYNISVDKFIHQIVLFAFSFSCAERGAGGAPAPVDQDADGHAAPADCDDTDPAVHPEALDTACDGIDLDCKGGDGPDADRDGVTTCAGDCADGDPSRFPGAAELCDIVDQDCDAEVDEGLDIDGDGLPGCGSMVVRPLLVRGNPRGGLNIGSAMLGVDIDHNGVDEVIVLDQVWPSADLKPQAWLYFSYSGCMLCESVPLENERRVEGVRHMGDLDGDGYEDVVLLTDGYPSSRFLRGGSGGTLEAWPSIQIEDDVQDAGMLHQVDGRSVAYLRIGSYSLGELTFDNGPRLAQFEALRMDRSDDAMMAADLTGDGRAEVMFLEQRWGFSDTNLQVYSWPPVNPPTGLQGDESFKNVRMSLAGDLNVDGYQDIVLSGRKERPSLEGEFLSQVSILYGSDPLSDRDQIQLESYPISLEGGSGPAVAAMSKPEPLIFTADYQPYGGAEELVLKVWSARHPRAGDSPVQSLSLGVIRSGHGISMVVADLDGDGWSEVVIGEAGSLREYEALPDGSWGRLIVLSTRIDCDDSDPDVQSGCSG